MVPGRSDGSFRVEGELNDTVAPRDVIHYIAGQYGDFVGKNLEFAGPTVDAMSIAGRQNIATRSAEVSAEFALFNADERALAYLRERTDRPFEPVSPDPDATYEAIHHIDVSRLTPQVALPGKVPHNIACIIAESINGLFLRNSIWRSSSVARPGTFLASAWCRCRTRISPRANTAHGEPL